MMVNKTKHKFGMRVDYHSSSVVGVQLWVLLPYEGETYSDFDTMKLIQLETHSIVCPMDVGMSEVWKIICNSIDDIVLDFMFRNMVEPSEFLFIGNTKLDCFRSIIQNRSIVHKTKEMEKAQ